MWNWDLILASGALVVLVALAIWTVIKVKKWREQDANEVVPTTRDELEPFCKMAEDGVLEPDELARIMQTHLDISPGPAQPPGEPASPASDQPPDASIREL